MGYYTAYSLEVAAEHDQIIRSRLASLAYPVPDGSGPDAGGFAISPFASEERWGTPDRSCKWYSCTADCLKVSAEFPTIPFTVHGHSEEDIEWSKRYEDGCVVAESCVDHGAAWR
jgi:hypothetical protein